MTVERTYVFADTFSGNANVVTLVAKATAPKPNRPQHLRMQTETGYRILSETDSDKWNMAFGDVLMRNIIFLDVFDV